MLTIFAFLAYASTPQTIRGGTTRNIPATGEEDWGDEVTNWIIDATAAINASPQSKNSKQYTAVVGSAAEVTAGNASHTTLSSAVSFATSGGNIYVRPGTHFVTSTIVISKPLTIEGNGEESVLAATAGFSTGAILEFATSGITVRQLKFESTLGGVVNNIIKVNLGVERSHIDVRTTSLGTNGFLNDITTNGENNKYGHYTWSTVGKSLNTLNYLYDASIVNPTTDDGLFRYNDKWVNKSLSGVTNETDISQSATGVTIGIVDPLITTKGGTGLSSWLVGQIPWYSSGTVLTQLPANGTATKQYLTMTSNVPSWKTISSADMPETDPVFATSTAYGVTPTLVNNWNTAYYYGGVFATSAAYTITPTNVTNWNTSYYYSGIFATSAAYSITPTNVTNWNTAYYYGGVFATSAAYTITPTKVTNWDTAYYQTNVWLTGTQPVNRGGSGNTVIGNNQVVYGKSTYYTSDSALTYDGTTITSSKIATTYNTPLGGKVASINTIAGTGGGNAFFWGWNNADYLSSITAESSNAYAGINFYNYHQTSNSTYAYSGSTFAPSRIRGLNGSIRMEFATSGSAAGNTIANWVDAVNFSATGIVSAPIATNVVTGAAVLVSGGGSLGVATSSKIYKQNLREIDIDMIMKLNPIKFDYIDPRGGNNHYGAIAEDVEKIAPELVIYKDKKPYSIRHIEFSFLALKLAQEEHRKVLKLEARLEDIEKRLEKLEKRKSFGVNKWGK